MPARRRPEPPQRLVRISDLARDSGVAVATIKHYMREGLLPGPARKTSRNMAYYDPRLAERVRTIKELQQRRYLPLKVIAELLEPSPSAALRAGADVERRELGALEPQIRAGSEVARRRRAAAPPTARKRRREILATLDITARELDELAAQGLVEPEGKERGEPVYGGADLEILEVIDETRRRGLGDLFPMPILGPYAEAVRALVRMELDLFRRQVLAGARLPPAPPPDIARDATALGERLVVALRAKLVVPELRALAGPPPPRRSNKK